MTNYDTGDLESHISPNLITLACDGAMPQSRRTFPTTQTATDCHITSHYITDHSGSILQIFIVNHHTSIRYDDIDNYYEPE